MADVRDAPKRPRTPSPLGDSEPPTKIARIDADAMEPAAGTETPAAPSAQPHTGDRMPSASEMLTESDVGITEYMDPEVRLTGIIKHRFGDFLVWEVGPDGQVAHLTNLRVAPAQAPPSQPAAPSAPTEPVDPKSWPEDADEKLAPILSADKIAELREFVGKGLKWGRKGKGGKRADDEHVISGPVASKDERKDFHRIIREVFTDRLATEHYEIDGTAHVEISWATVASRSRGTPRPPKPEPDMKYIHFTLQKVNRETHDAISSLAKILRVPNRDLGMLGTKDKRGITVQRVSLRRGKLSLEDVQRALAEAGAPQGGGRGGRGGRGAPRGRGGRGRGGGFGGNGPDPAMRGLKAGDYAYAAEALELGRLQGNRFLITLRDVKAESPEIIERGMQTIRDRGFINYYGMQRFGMSGKGTGTHDVGLALLKSDWTAAIDLILKPRSGDSQDAAMAREQYAKTGDIAEALKHFPRNLVAERVILESYRKEGSTANKWSAIAQIPKNLRMMYVHAYQSAIWNTVVSERLVRFGKDKPVVGDIVYADATAQDVEAPVADEEGPVVETEDAEASTSTKADETSELTGDQATMQRLRDSSKLPAVKVLTEDDLSSYTIFDVLLPLPGFAITYPGAELGEIYRSTLVRDSLDPDNLYRKQPEFSMSGAYRKILHKPTSLEYRVLKYDDPTAPLAQTDEDKLFGRPPPPPTPSAASTALQIELTLGSSTYATMMLRELLKSETGSLAQRLLTEAMESAFAARGRAEWEARRAGFDAQQKAADEAEARAGAKTVDEPAQASAPIETSTEVADAGAMTTDETANATDATNAA